MPVVLPEIMTRFECNLQGCCCWGWRISFDADDVVELWSRLSGEEREQSIRGTSFVVTDENIIEKIILEPVGNRQLCQFLSPDNLCSLQVRWGEDVVPQLCRAFPAFAVDVGCEIVLHYDLVCPVVLELVVSHMGPYNLLTLDPPAGSDLAVRAGRPATLPPLTIGNRSISWEQFRSVRQSILDAFNTREWSAITTLGMISVALARVMDGAEFHLSGDCSQSFERFLHGCVANHHEDALARYLFDARQFVTDLDIRGVTVADLTTHLAFDPAWSKWLDPYEEPFDDAIRQYLCHRFVCAFNRNINSDRLKFAYGTITHTLATAFRLAVGLSKHLKRKVDLPILRGGMCASEYLYRALRIPPEFMPWFGLEDL